MRLTYLDILEQCFRDKFRGYNKEEVDNFLHLVADDFKEMAEEIQDLRNELEQKDQLIKDLKKSGNGRPAGESAIPPISAEVLKEKAKRIFRLTQEKAEENRRRAEEELARLKADIQKLKSEKKSLLEALTNAAKKQLEQLKQQTGRPGSDHAAEDKDI